MERNLFEEIDLKIMLCNERIKNHKRSIDKAKKMCGWNGPQMVGGLDYNKDGSSQNVHISFAEGLAMIQKDEENIRRLKEERKDLRRSKRKIKKIYESLQGYEAQIYFNRVIMNRTQDVTADEMSLSVRQVQRLEKNMKDRCLM